MSSKNQAEQGGNRSKPRVVYWTKTTAPYMMDRFNALAKTAPFEFEAWISDRNAPGRSWDVNEKEWHFRYKYVPTTQAADRVLHWPLFVLSRRPDVLIGGYAEPSRIIGWLLAKSLGIKTGFRVLSRSASWVKPSPVKEWIKRFMFRHVNAVETPGEDGKAYAVSLGCAPDKVHFATHTVAKHFFDKVDDQNAKALRQQLGCRGLTFIYVGRLWEGKGVQFLLDAFEQFQKTMNVETTLLLVGDGVDERKFRQQCTDNDTQNVLFAGFVQRDELATYYAASDVFVFPTLGDPYGIVVDEAMACSLPVLSTTTAGEIRARVEDGVNGYLVPPSDSDALAEAMAKFAHNKTTIKEMGQASREKVLSHTAEQWAKDFAQLVASLTTREK